MTVFALRRLLLLIPVLLSVATITFFLQHLTPGDPVDILVGDSGHERRAGRPGGASSGSSTKTAEPIPVVEQYTTYLGHLLLGDLGTSVRSDRSVTVARAGAVPPDPVPHGDGLRPRHRPGDSGGSPGGGAAGDASSTRRSWGSRSSGSPSPPSGSGRCSCCCSRSKLGVLPVAGASSLRHIDPPHRDAGSSP